MLLGMSAALKVPRKGGIEVFSGESEVRSMFLAQL